MSYQQSPLHSLLNLYQVVDKLMEVRIDSPDLTIYDFAAFQELECYRAYLNSPAGYETLNMWQKLFIPAWTPTVQFCDIVSQHRCVSEWSYSRYLLGGPRVSFVYNYNTGDILIITSSLQKMLGSLIKMSHKAQQSAKAS